MHRRPVKYLRLNRDNADKILILYSYYTNTHPDRSHRYRAFNTDLGSQLYFGEIKIGYSGKSATIAKNVFLYLVLVTKPRLAKIYYYLF